MRRKSVEEPASFTDEANASGLSQLASGTPAKQTYDADAKDGTYVPMRRWHCVNATNCKGRVKWTGWDQEIPRCPECNGRMSWNQWLVCKD